MIRFQDLLFPLLLAVLLAALFIGGRMALSHQFRPLRAMRQSAVESLRRPQGMPPAPVDAP
jgi:hypothetical protein